MIQIFLSIFHGLAALVRSRVDLALEIVALGPQHLHKIFASYFNYYSRSRTHLSLAKDCSEHREVAPPNNGKVIALPKVGGLHHRYCRQRAA